jgi:hypothetical protein
MILAALALAGLVQNDPSGATSFMQQVLSTTRALAIERSRRGMTYRKQQTVTDIEDEQNPITESNDAWRVRAVGTGTVARHTLHNGEPIQDDPESPDFNVLEAMLTKYQFTWAAEPETGSGSNRCFNVEFTPLDPDAHADTIEERIANHLTGIACVDAQRFFIRRIDAHLYEPFKIRFGARMKRVHMTIVQRLVDDIPVQEWSTTDIFYAVFGIDSAKRHSVRYDNWQFAGPASTPTP